jgi:integrase
MRTIGKLKALNVAREKRPGMYGDGGGLWLQVTSAGARSWVFRYRVAEHDPATGEFLRHPATGKVLGRAREMGLGSAAVVTLDAARERAVECRRMREQGIDPIGARQDARRQASLDKAKSVTFKDAAAAYMAAHRAGWRNEKHAGQWTATLATYAYPVIGELSAQAIDTALVMKVLEPLWTTRAETASRLRGRIESILDWARVRGYRSGENPARWRGHLDHLLPARAKVQRVQHHNALAYADVPAFMGTLRAREGTRARALEFLILTAARTGEVIDAKWSEIDLSNAAWVIPAGRMKSGREHRVPLAARALEILKALPCEGEYVFARGNQALSDRALINLFRGMHPDAVVHGFRSAFRDWCAEQTAYPNHVVEQALAHTITNAVERAYRRGDLFDKRRRLMADWSAFCSQPAAVGSKVVPMRSA